MTSDDPGVAPAKRASVNRMREVVKAVLEGQLGGLTGYNGDSAPQLIKQLSDDIKSGLKGMGLERYKFVVQVSLGEQRGEGVRVGSRCFWQPDTDCCATEKYISVSN
jgi:hypothetical protein